MIGIPTSPKLVLCDGHLLAACSRRWYRRMHASASVPVVRRLFALSATDSARALWTPRPMAARCDLMGEHGVSIVSLPMGDM